MFDSESLIKLTTKMAEVAEKVGELIISTGEEVSDTTFEVSEKNVILVGAGAMLFTGILLTGSGPIPGLFLGFPTSAFSFSIFYNQAIQKESILKQDE